MHHKQRYLRLVILHFILYLVNRHRRFFVFCSRSFRNDSFRSNSFRNCCRRRFAKTSFYLLFLALLVKIYYMLQKDLAILIEFYVVILFVATKTTLSRAFANEIKSSFRKILIKLRRLKLLYLLSTLLRIYFRRQ